MYNPYNWTIKNEKKKNNDNCLIDELTRLSNEIDMCKVERVHLENKLSKCNLKIDELEKKKWALLNKLFP